MGGGAAFRTAAAGEPCVCVKMRSASSFLSLGPSYLSFFGRRGGEREAKTVQLFRISSARSFCCIPRKCRVCMCACAHASKKGDSPLFG